MAFTSAGIKDPKIGVEGKFSLWFLAALALAEGDVSLEKFTDERVNDPRLAALRGRVNAHLVRELKLGARVAVKMNDGRTYEAFRASPKGSPDNPLGFEEIGAKFHSAAKKAISQPQIEDLIERIENLESQPDMADFVRLTQPQ